MPVSTFELAMEQAEKAIEAINKQTEQLHRIADLLEGICSFQHNALKIVDVDKDE
jgi:hypothetical protein